MGVHHSIARINYDTAHGEAKASVVASTDAAGQCLNNPQIRVANIFSRYTDSKSSYTCDNVSNGVCNSITSNANIKWACGSNEATCYENVSFKTSAYAIRVAAGSRPCQVLIYSLWKTFVNSQFILMQ